MCDSKMKEIREAYVAQDSARLERAINDAMTDKFLGMEITEDSKATVTDWLGEALNGKDASPVSEIDIVRHKSGWYNNGK